MAGAVDLVIYGPTGELPEMPGTVFGGRIQSVECWEGKLTTNAFAHLEVLIKI